MSAKSASKKPAKEKKPPKGTPQNPHRPPEYAELGDLKTGTSVYYEIESWVGNRWEYWGTEYTQEAAERTCKRIVKETLDRVKYRQRWDYDREHGNNSGVTVSLAIKSDTSKAAVDEFINNVQNVHAEQKKKGKPKFKFVPPTGKKAPVARWRKFEVIKRQVHEGEVR